MSVFRFATLALSLVTLTRAALAQAPTTEVDLASLGLRVTDLRTTDSLVTAGRVLRPGVGQKLVLATLTGGADRSFILLSAPTQLAAQYGRSLALATALAVSGAGESRPNWIVPASADPRTTPQLHAVVRPGPVTVLALFEVPTHAASLSITVPQARPGVSTISGPAGGRD